MSFDQGCCCCFRHTASVAASFRLADTLGIDHCPALIIILIDLIIINYNYPLKIYRDINKNYIIADMN